MLPAKDSSRTFRRKSRLDSMSRAAKTILVFGIYVMLSGALLATFPNFMLGTLGLAQTQEIWIRLLGAQIVVVGFYYSAAARGEAVAFFRATLYGRTGMALYLFVLVGLGLVGPAILVFGVIEIVGAAATALALGRDGRPAQAVAGRAAVAADR
jgi:hypothetical protein